MDFDDLNALQQRLKQLLVLGVPKDQRSRKITLLDVGHAKAKVIQTLRDLFSLSLIEAKSLVDSTPSELPSVESEAPDIDAISRKIDEAVWTLECAGAQVHAEPSATWDVTPYDQDLFAFTPELALAPTWELIAQVYSGPKEGFGRLWPWLISSRPSWQAQTDLWR
ncbi:MAG: ribosomal protein L7/L12, partial [Planctomycetota bacterium]